MKAQPRFLADGHQRARAAQEAAVRKEVEQEFAEPLRQASFLGRLLIRRRICREIERRLDRLDPPDALYLVR